MQAHALGATGTLFRPLDREDVLHRLSLLDLAAPRNGRHAPVPTDQSGSAAIFASMFSAVLDGTPIALGWVSALRAPTCIASAFAATLHDVGKASIPLAILDKPGRLGADEERIMREHPVLGFDALKSVAGVDPEVLGAVRHHHEYLDGSGYPDALSAADIPDIVRRLTISDIFAALIEQRPYRPPMSRQKACAVLGKMNGKLEQALVRAFKPVALSA